MLLKLLYHNFINKSRRKPCISSIPQGIAYHQYGVLYIIKPQKNTRWRVMRCKGGSPPLMICTALRAAMICQACGLDKQKRNFWYTKVPFLLVRETGLEPVRLPTRPSNVRVCRFRHSRIYVVLRPCLTIILKQMPFVKSFLKFF